MRARRMTGVGGALLAFALLTAAAPAEVPLVEGLRRTIAWYRTSREARARVSEWR